MSELMPLLALVVAVAGLTILVMGVSLMIRIRRYTESQTTKAEHVLLELQKQNHLMKTWTEDGLPVRTPKKVTRP